MTGIGSMRTRKFMEVLIPDTVRHHADVLHVITNSIMSASVRDASAAQVVD